MLLLVELWCQRQLRVLLLFWKKWPQTTINSQLKGLWLRKFLGFMNWIRLLPSQLELLLYLIRFQPWQPKEYHKVQNMLQLQVWQFRSMKLVKNKFNTSTIETTTIVVILCQITTVQGFEIMRIFLMETQRMCCNLLQGLIVNQTRRRCHLRMPCSPLESSEWVV